MEFLIGIGVFGLIVWLIQQVVSTKASESGLKVQISSLKESNSDLKRKFEHIEQENINLKSDITKYTHRKEVLSKYTFDKKTGVFFHNETQEAYCPRCLDKSKETQMQDETQGYRCNICPFYASKLF